MLADIVVRLRRQASTLDYSARWQPFAGSLSEQAADEIERLRIDVEAGRMFERAANQTRKDLQSCREQLVEIEG